MKTGIAEVQEQVQKFWSPLFMDELRESLLLASLVNKDYEGAIAKQGDTVYVSQITTPVGQLKTVGVDADTFNSEKLQTTRIAIQADKRAVAAFEMEDLVDVQSQLGSENSKIRESLLFAVKKQINDYLYSLVSPSVATPDHVLSGIATMSAAQVSAHRKLAAQAKWRKEGGWWQLSDPGYYSQMLDDSTLSSTDFGGTDAPKIGGVIAKQRFGINHVEDNSEGLLSLSPAGAAEKVALTFHPDFMHMVMQMEPRFKISDLHGHKQFAYLLSVDLLFGAKLGIDGDKKHILTYNT